MIKKFKNLPKIIKEKSNNIEEILLQNARVERIVKENNWGLIFNSAICGSPWFKNIPLNVGRWAASYSLLYILYRVLNEIKPINIIEFGLGESTKMIQAYKQFHNPSSNCITVESEEEWIKMRLNNGISENYITIIQANTTRVPVASTTTLAYEKLPEKLSPLNQRYNLILIDGPVGSNHFSRSNVIELIEEGFLDEEFIIIMDDFERSGEQQTVDEIKRLLINKEVPFESGEYSGMKNQFLICSKGYKYLTTL